MSRTIRTLAMFSYCAYCASGDTGVKRSTSVQPPDNQETWIGCEEQKNQQIIRNRARSKTDNVQQTGKGKNQYLEDTDSSLNSIFPHESDIKSQNYHRRRDRQG